MTPFLRRFFSLTFLGAGVVLFAACSGESEGQRCELTDDPGGANNGPGGSDCASNLQCYAASTLGGVAALYAQEQSDPNLGICCPANRQQATTSICAVQLSPPGGDGGFVDAATDGASAPGSEAGADASSSDSSSDAPEDSPGDGPG
jgi:hypothetical protein